MTETNETIDAMSRRSEYSPTPARLHTRRATTKKTWPALEARGSCRRAWRQRPRLAVGRGQGMLLSAALGRLESREGLNALSSASSSEADASRAPRQPRPCNQGPYVLDTLQYAHEGLGSSIWPHATSIIFADAIGARRCCPRPRTLFLVRKRSCQTSFASPPSPQSALGAPRTPHSCPPLPRRL